MKILIGADLVPTKNNISLFESADTEALVGQDLMEILSSSDFNIFNLEVPLVDEASPIKKCGPALIAPTNSINGIKAIGVDLFTLANNHILDQGENGLISTCNLLKSNNVDYVGVGNNVEEAAKPYIFRTGDKTVGVYACAEHEFSIATDKNMGANPFDPLESLDHVAELKKQCDYVIVLYHGGKEHYRYPSPMLQKICRKLVDKGADLVVCQHTHCIGCEEKYNGGTIVYGQGNFLFDYSTSEYWETSMLISVNGDGEVSYIPLKKQGNSVRLAEDEDAKEIIDGFSKRSAEIKREGFIEARYKKFAESMIKQYLFSFAGLKRGFVYKVFDKLSGHRMTDWILNKKYPMAKKLVLENFTECEAHRELLIAGLKLNDNESEV